MQSPKFLHKIAFSVVFSGLDHVQKHSFGTSNVSIFGRLNLVIIIILNVSILMIYKFWVLAV